MPSARRCWSSTRWGEISTSASTPWRATVEQPSATVAKRLRVGARREVEALDDGAAPRALDVGREAVERHERVERRECRRVGFVEPHGAVGEQVERGDVILVAVTQEAPVDLAAEDVALRSYAERRVDEHRLAAPSHEERAAVRVASARGCDERDRGPEAHLLDVPDSAPAFHVE